MPRRVAQQVKPQDRANVGFLAMPVVGDRSHDQNEYQYRCHCLEGTDEDLAEEGQVAGRAGGQQGQGDTASKPMTICVTRLVRLRGGKQRSCAALSRIL